MSESRWSATRRSPGRGACLARCLLGAAVLAAASPGGVGALAEDPAAGPPVAVLQGLNKTTARVSTVEAPVGGVARFGTLEITARACAKKPPTEPPESAAYLEVVDVRPDSPSVEVFAGWMFASSPGISALEHPVYDVWVIDCRRESAAESAAVPPSAGDEVSDGSADAGEPFPEDPEGEATPEDQDTPGDQ